MPDKKLTDAEIIKALECCKCGTLNDCDGCPCFSDEDINTARECAENLMSNALDLINRLQADRDNYKQIAENQQKIILDKAFENKKLKAEIERLRTENKALRMAIELCKGWEERAKAEAYKEFAEGLKKSYCEWSPNDDAFYDFVFEEIDNLLKELVGDSQ